MSSIIKLPDPEYRRLNRFANSDLSEFKRLLIGDNRKLPQNAFRLGSAFHTMLLEPEKLIPSVWNEFSEEEQDKLLAMYHSATQDKLLMAYLETDRKEEVHLFEAEDMKCKAKLDLLPNGEKIVDLKTTSAKSYQQFVNAILRYDYHRQGAFYAKASGRRGAVFIGVQKQEPYQVFHVDLTDWSGPSSLLAGEHLFRQLLRQIKSSNYIPSSWKISELSE